MRGKLLHILLTLCVILAFKSPDKEFKNSRLQHWVDSVYSTLTLEQKFGQLFMVAAYSNKGAEHQKEIETLIKDYHIGGLIFMQGGPYRQAVLTNRYQSLSKIPLMIAMDAEWGPSMRLDSTVKYPRQIVMGAMPDDSLMFRMGVHVAEQLQRLGVHINFAPVVDVNSNPQNPVIGTRSFGENKERVAKMGIAYSRGLQSKNVMAVAKHFPGHGDTDSDSHHTLPVLNHSKERMDSVELYPFKQIFQTGVKGVMVAHLYVPAYDDKKNQATTLSPYVVTEVLQNKLGYEGLIFTDALNMQGVAKFHKAGDVDYLAYMAGNDVMLFSEDVEKAVKRMIKAYKKDEITERDLERRVKKILAAKYWMGLHDYNPVPLNNINQDINHGKYHALIKQIALEAATLVKDDNKIIPVRDVINNKFASLSIGVKENPVFTSMLDNYCPNTHFFIESKLDKEAHNQMLEKLKDFDIVNISLMNMNGSAQYKYGISTATIEFLKTLDSLKKITVSVFGNPYSLSHLEEIKTLICAYDETEASLWAVPQLIFGAKSFKGILPVSASGKIKEGKGISTKTLQRLAFAVPEQMEMDSKKLAEIDKVAEKAISSKSTPGCQILIAKDNHVIFQKSYGHLDYNGSKKVNNMTVYDIASLTKVAGTLQAIMLLESEDKIDLSRKASYYLPELKNTNKEDMHIKEIMAHQAGLTPWIPYWKATLEKDGSYSEVFYCNYEDGWFCKPLIDGIYTMSALRDTLWKWTINSPLREPINAGKKSGKKRKPIFKVYKYDYKYSDLGFYIMREIVERITNQPIEDYLKQNFFQPLGAATLTYRPLEIMSKENIAPTELDKTFRHTLVHGTVHDQGAAMMNGVGGHAGLFSNAIDLAKLLQMNLNNGSYGGDNYFSAHTIEKFTKRYFEDDKNRRGLGWDRPVLEGETGGPASALASPNTYGHTGFTGTAAWIDPDHNLIYIFLSNRVHPDAENNKLINLNIRTEIQDIIYRSIIKEEVEIEK